MASQKLSKEEFMRKVREDIQIKKRNKLKSEWDIWEYSRTAFNRRNRAIKTVR